MLAPYTFVRERFFPFGSQQVSLSGEKRFVFLFIIHRLHPLHLSPDRLPSPLKRLILFQFQTFFHPIVCPFQSLISNSVNGKRFKSACFPADVQCVPTINTHSLERTIGKNSIYPDFVNTSISINRRGKLNIASRLKIARPGSWEVINPS